MSETTFSDFEELKITESSKSFLLESARWAKFLSIVGFVGIGLMTVGAFFMIATGASLGGGRNAAPVAIVGVAYILAAALYFFPTYYLYNFATKMKKAILNISQEDADKGLENLKSMFKFVGILTIVILSFYILSFLLVLAVGVSMF